ncbi:hypothetical protein V6N13_008205 [Hibiscus sabdariffa]
MGGRGGRLGASGLSPISSKWRAGGRRNSDYWNRWGFAKRTSNPPGMVCRRARKSMSGAAGDSTTKFPISGKVPLEWLMHRLGSSRPGHAQSVGVFVTPGRPTTRVFGLVDARSRWLCATCLDNVTPNTGSPCVATVQLGGMSRPSNARASARSMSQWVLLLRQPPLSCPPLLPSDFLFAPT